MRCHPPRHRRGMFKAVPPPARGGGFFVDLSGRRWRGARPRGDAKLEGASERQLVSNADTRCGMRGEECDAYPYFSRATSQD